MFLIEKSQITFISSSEIRQYCQWANKLCYLKVLSCVLKKCLCFNISKTNMKEIIGMYWYTQKLTGRWIFFSIFQIKVYTILFAYWTQHRTTTLYLIKMQSTQTRRLDHLTDMTNCQIKQNYLTPTNHFGI